MAESKVRVIHYADPWCWWSWGLEPVLRRLEAVYGDRLEVIYRMGGMAEDIDEWRKEYGVDEEGTVSWVEQSVEMTKMPVNPDYFRTSGVSSSYPACQAFKAAELQDPHRAHRFFRRMMEAFQVEARPQTEAEFADLAAEVGLDGERLVQDMASPQVEEAFATDRAEMNVNFLSLLLEGAEEAVALGEVFTTQPFEKEIDQLAPGLPKRSPADILEYLETLQGHLVPAQEVAEVFHISADDAETRLRDLETAGLLTSRTYPFATYWIPQAITVEKLPLEVVKTSHVASEARVETESDLTPIVTTAVQDLYTEVAAHPEKPFHFPLGLEALIYVGYPEAEVAKLPTSATESFAGVGYPFAAEVIQAGDTVVDVGSGSGTDVLYAALQVGPQGKVYGVDFTLAMIEKAQANVARMKASRVKILEGNATEIPLPDATADVITSNGVLNLVPDKPAAFREIFRVLKPGGYLQLADIIVQENVGAVCGLNPQLWADCIGGAAVEAEYLATIAEAGFEAPKVLRRLDYFAQSPSESTKRLTKSFEAESVSLVTRKPGNSEGRD